MTDIEESSSSDNADAAEAELTPGQLLLQARERAQLTQDQVAQALHMTVNKVKAIESDDYGKMNVDTFARGYLRSYAGLLKIDAANLIAAYEKQLRARGLLRAAEDVSIKEQAARKGWGFIAALLGFLLLLLLISVWFFDNRIAPSPEILPAQTLVPETTVTGAALTNAESDEEALIDENAEGEVSTTTESVAPDVTSTTEAAETVTTTGAAVTAVNQVVELDRLDLEFSDECWLEVSDAQGDVLATDLQRSGSRLTLSGKKPFQVKLGFAAAASIKLNGESVAIAPQSGVKVLTLSVGE